MKIAGQECTVARAYDLLAADATLVDKLDATPEERERLVTYATLRSHHDYLRDLQAARLRSHHDYLRDLQAARGGDFR